MAWIALASVAAKTYSDSKKAEAAGKPAVNNAPDFRTSEAVFDNSGWNVSFGQSKIDSTAVKTTDLAGASAPGSGLDMGQGIGAGMGLGQVDQRTLLIGAGVIVAAVLLKRKKA